MRRQGWGGGSLLWGQFIVGKGGGGGRFLWGGAGWAGGFQRGEGGESYGCGVLCVGCVVMGHAAIPRD